MKNEHDSEEIVEVADELLNEISGGDTTVTVTPTSTDFTFCK